MIVSDTTRGNKIYRISSIICNISLKIMEYNN